VLRGVQVLVLWSLWCLGRHAVMTVMTVCDRWFATARLPGSNLLLVIATRDCFPAGDCNVPVLLQAPVENILLLRVNNVQQ